MLTTRCPSGEVLPGYAFPGGSTEWWEAGAIFSGTLASLKARVLLALGLGSGLEVRGLATLCEAWNGGMRHDSYEGATNDVDANATRAQRRVNRAGVLSE